MKSFKKLLAVGFVSFFAMSLPAQAQIPTTDVANLIQQGLQYAQQIQQYARQGLQLESELKNLIQNPASLLGSDVGRLINGVGSVMSATNSIGGSFAQIDRNFASTFKSPTTATLSQNFARWHSTSTATLEGALKAAGMHRDQFATDTDALTALYNESQASGGNLQALQSLAKINSMQVQQTQKLGDLIAAQNIASNTYMAAQIAKEDANRKAFDQIATPYTAQVPRIETAPVVKWNDVLFKK
jgi:P-type conjugative transfer protein TrbJ